MKRTLTLLIAVVVVGAIAWYAIRVPAASPTAWERAFAQPNIDEIATMLIADREGRRTSFKRGGPTGWTVNGQPANENAMKNLLQAIRTIEVQRLPSSKAIPNLVANLAGGGILVQLFDVRGRKLRGYYVGGGVNGELGTAAIMEESDNPYVVHLPMWSGNLRHRYSLRDDEWRSKRLLAVDPERVAHLSIEYPRQRAQSFKLQRATEGTFVLNSFYADGRPPRELPFAAVEGALSRYESYYASRYENDDLPSIERARNTLPFATLRVREINGEEIVLDIYPRFRDPEGGQELSAYTAFVNGGADWVLLPVETTQPLLLSYDSF